MRRLRLGIAGLGRGFMLMLPTLARDPRLTLAAAADPRPEARARFTRDFAAATYATVEGLAADPTLDAIYLATPHQFHVEHVRAAAAGGKHVMVEKPMALTLADCDAMIGAAADAGIHLLVGHSHSFDAPYLRTRALIESGAFGRVRMITALNYTDFLYRPRRPEELDTAQGGGVVFSQAAHQLDIVRLLGGGRLASLRASTGAWDPARPTEGAYNAFLAFADGASATIAYSGFAHFDSDELCGWVGELGQARDPDAYGAARAGLAGLTPEAEAALKTERAYGAGTAAAAAASAPQAHNHFGFVMVSCDHADLRPLPTGIMIYGDGERRFEPLPAPTVPRAEVVDELCAAVFTGRPPLHSGEWGRATLEACLAVLSSGRSGREVVLERQVGVRAGDLDDAIDASPVHPRDEATEP